MLTPCPPSRDEANIGTAASCERSRRMLRSNLVIVEKARELFPVKTALQLAEITGCPVRTVESWLTGHVKIPADAFVALLHSEHGRDFLAGVMAGQQWRWWLQLRAFFSAIDLAVAQRAHRRKMKALLDAEYSSEIPHAALFQDEDFPRSAPVAARPVHRAVVARKTR